MPSRSAWVGVGVALAAASCAVVGYDLDGYTLAEAGGGGAAQATSSAHTRAASTTGGGHTVHGSSTSATGGAGGGGGPVEADCLNALDDDDDGDVDCRDTDCATRGFACVAVPPGWSGPAALYLGSDASVTCGGAYPTTLVAGGTAVTAAALSCNACGCGAGPCDPPVAYVYSDGACNALAAQWGPAGPACYASPGASWPAVTMPHAAAYACPVTGGGEAVREPAAFADHAVLCGPERLGGGCDDAVCTAPAAAGFTVCLYAAGAGLTCPPGTTAAATVYATLDDQRACSGCACAANAPTCGTGIFFYGGAGDTACVTATNGANDAGCHGIGTFNSLRPVSTHPGCTASGGASLGAVTPTDPTTVCCYP